MWTNLTFLHIWHVCDVENASTCVNFMLFCCKVGFVSIYALLCGEKNYQKLLMWGENDKYDV